MGLLEKIFGNYSDKEIKRLTPTIDRTEAIGEELRNISEGELRGKTDQFKKRLAAGETLDDLLPEAFAVVREATDRLTQKRHYRVQLLGGAILHQGRIAEMRTGEGKTQTIALPIYLNALSGKGVHMVTVNDYLAKYHAELMGEIYGWLGLTTGCIIPGLQTQERREQYACDVTYCVNNELGFDYLRDNMVVNESERVLRELNYAIIDEVDSILIDEARVPMIISRPGDKPTQVYSRADQFVKTLKKGRITNEEDLANPLYRKEVEEEGDFVVDEKRKAVTLTQEGTTKAERYFGIDNLSDPDNIEIMHHVNNALKANYNQHRDIDYVNKDGEIILVDVFTGRLMPGRRASEGLHQAIEAKENVKVQRESKTAATITFQNFFNKYAKKAGATGTAITEENEFREIYGMDVVTVPTNLPMIRIDQPDAVFRTEAGKFRAIVRDVEDCYKRRQPVLVGTASIEKSEVMSALLKRAGVKHEVLNAKHHEREAEIIAEAGQAGHVTIATNMAGRGTDIMLGEGVRELGGLKVIGTERHEARRIDNQLRGRSGRQGDPGESRFYISFEDELMRLFGGDSISKLANFIKMDEDDVIEHNMVSNAVEKAQKKVENNNFGIRKHLLQYDRVMNEQREIIYSQRDKVISGENIREKITSMIKDVISRTVDSFCQPQDTPEEWDLEGLNKDLAILFHKPALDIAALRTEFDTITHDKIKDQLHEQALQIYDKREIDITPDRMREIERIVMMECVDKRWMDHIDDMHQMRQSISLRSFAQRDPLIEYQFLSYDMFEDMSNGIQQDTVRILFNFKIAEEGQMQMRQAVRKEDLSTNSSDGPVAKQPTRRAEQKIGPNSPCPCGSGNKYKRCCGNK